MLATVPRGFERNERNRGVEWVLPGVERSLWMIPVVWAPALLAGFFYTGGEGHLGDTLLKTAVFVSMVILGRFGLHKRQRLQALADGLMFEDGKGGRVRVDLEDIQAVDVRRRDDVWRGLFALAKHAEIVIHTPRGEVKLPCHLGSPDNAPWLAYELQQQLGVEGRLEA